LAIVSVANASLSLSVGVPMSGALATMPLAATGVDRAGVAVGTAVCHATGVAVDATGVERLGSADSASFATS
jgi:hypothetical protein